MVKTYFKILLKGKMRNSLIVADIFYKYSDSKFHVISQKEEDGNPRGVLYENSSILNRTVPTPVSAPEEGQAACGWQAGHASTMNRVCCRTVATSHPGGRVPFLRLFHPIPTLFQLQKGKSTLKADQSSTLIKDQYRREYGNRVT